MQTELTNRQPSQPRSRGGGQCEGSEHVNLWRTFKLRRKLRKMERALRIHLNDEQRNVVLNSNPPNALNGWARRSGKTTCACMHLLLHSPVKARYSACEAMRLLKDPDKNLGPQVKRWTYQHLYGMYLELKRQGIRTCVLHPPMPNIPDGYVGHGRYDGSRKDEGRRRP